MSAPIDVSDPGPKLDFAEQGMKDYMRKASGVAELLGPNGAATLREIDATERQAVAALIAEVRAKGALRAAPGTGALVSDLWRPYTTPPTARLASVVTQALPGGTGPKPVAGGESLFGAFMFTMMAPELYARLPRNASGDLGQQTLTQEMTTRDGSDLVVPVSATLGSGGVSVSPSGSPVPAPATFQYKAPDQDRQTPTVNLETHSRRGIATLVVTFNTGTSAYTVDGTYFGVYRITGTICDLVNPFKLNGDAPEIVARGVFSFTPAGANVGTWKYAGKMGPSGGALSYKGSGGYTVVMPADSASGVMPILRMAGGTDWTITAPIVGTMPLGEGVHLGPGDDVKLVPSSACRG